MAFASRLPCGLDFLRLSELNRLSVHLPCSFQCAFYAFCFDRCDSLLRHIACRLGTYSGHPINLIEPLSWAARNSPATIGDRMIAGGKLPKLIHAAVSAQTDFFRYRMRLHKWHAKRTEKCSCTCSMYLYILSIVSPHCRAQRKS